MLDYILFFTYSLILVYSITVLYSTITWKKIGNSQPIEKFPQEASLRSISVVIPVRNEASNIVKLLKCLELQTHENFEVIVVDDHSDDNTFQIIEDFQFKSVLKIKILQLESTYGKKNAITKAVHSSDSELIVTTDADCLMGKDWLVSISNHFLETNAFLISSPVKIGHQGNWFQKLQAVEFSTLIGIGAISIFLKKPSMCNGANLAYPKKIFEIVGGYKDSLDIPTGDDAFLLEKIKALDISKISFFKNQNAIVTTKPAENFHQFYQQRKRWASKWNAHQDGNQNVIAVGLFFMYLFWIISLVLVITNHASLSIFIIFSLLKYTAEYYYLSKILKFFNLKKLVRYIPILYLLYPFYTLLFGIAVQFGKYEWKGRTI